jgi:hypothetical protein
VDDDFQTEEELAAHFGPEGPVLPVAEWLRCLLERDDLEAAWPLTTHNFRLVMAQAFLWANRAHPGVAGHDLDDAASELAGLSFDHDLWSSFEHTQLVEFHGAFDQFFSAHYGVASRPRPVAIGYEIVKFVKTEDDQPLVVTEPTFVEAHVFLMQSTGEGWLVAGQGVDTPPEPGWPPTPGHASF